MKKIFFAIIFALSTHAFAADGGEQTLFDVDSIYSGGYGCPELKLGQFNGDWGLMVGGRGGWIVNSVFSIGGGGWGLATEHTLDGFANPDPGRYEDEFQFEFGMGGFFFEYINSSDKMLHFAVNSFVGWGGVSVEGKLLDPILDIDDEIEREWETVESTSVFIVEPGVTADFNVTTFFRISAGASYRIVNGFDLDGFEAKDFGGLSFNLAFKFGKF